MEVQKVKCAAVISNSGSLEQLFASVLIHKLCSVIKCTDFCMRSRLLIAGVQLAEE